MTTFLEYVCERLMGPPAKPGGSVGESYWLCPFHDDHNPSFHTLPHKPQYKDRWQCFACGMRGDAADLVKEFYPGEDWPRRRVRLDQWRQEYEGEGEVKPADREGKVTANGRNSSFSLRGPGSKGPNRVYDVDPEEDQFSPEAGAAVAELIDLAGGDSLCAATREKLVLLKAALEVCGRYRLHPLGLV